MCPDDTNQNCVNPAENIVRTTEKLAASKPILSIAQMHNNEQKVKGAAMTEKTESPVSELFEQAMKSYEQALKTGVKLQEEAGKCFANLFNQTPVPQEWQKRVNAAIEETFPVARKNLEENLKFVEQNSRVSLDLFKQAVEATQSVSFADAQAKLQKLWQSLLNALQNNVQAMAQANSKFMESCTAFARKGWEPAAAKAK
jgi:hypothetical protein